MAKESWVQPTADEFKELATLSASIKKLPGYRVVKKQQIPSIFHPVLKDKCDHAVIMASGTSDNTVLFVCNAIRVDKKDSAIDQEPFGIAIVKNEPSPSGLFLHHGNWDGRTERNLPKQFWDHGAASGVGNYFPFSDMPVNSSNGLDRIPVESHLNAFSDMVRRLRNSGQAGADKSNSAKE